MQPRNQAGNRLTVAAREPGEIPPSPGREYPRRILPWAILAVGIAGSQSAFTDEPLPPVLKLRFDEDYGALRNQPTRRDWPFSWKYLSLDGTPHRFASIGGEVRQRYEYTEDPLFGQDPQDKHGVWLQRYVLHGDLHLNRSLRVFAQLASALETGRSGGPSPVDEDRLDWQNLFVDMGHALSPDREAKLRAGRQEVALGSGRLVDVREGPNVRRTFDGGRALVELEGWHLDALALRPRENEPGVFDDGTDTGKALWGFYGTTEDVLLHGGALDVYYLGYENHSATFAQGSARELRHSVGARYWGEQGNWSWNWEALHQFGNFGNGDIDAWTLATETGYRWQQSHWKPQLRFSINIASGDSDLKDSELGTFNPLFPRGNYFSEAAVFGPRNFYNFHAFLDLQPGDSWSLTADLNFFWRLETADGLYSPSGQLIRGPGDSDAHFAATALSLTAEYTFCRGLVFTAIHTFVEPKAFIRNTGPSEDIDFSELTLQYRF